MGMSVGENKGGSMAEMNVVPLIDIGQHDGVPFAVMHYLTGGSLRDRQPRGEDGQSLPMKIETLHAWLPAIAGAVRPPAPSHAISASPTPY